VKILFSNREEIIYAQLLVLIMSEKTPNRSHTIEADLMGNGIIQA